MIGRAREWIDQVAILGMAGMLCATVLQQIPGPIYARIRAKDPGAFIPMWSFFAPRPATRDYEPLHRFVLSDESTTEWQRSIVHGSRKLVTNIWAPKRRLSKSIFDMSSDILPLLNQRDSLAVENSPAYVSLSKFYSRLAREQSTKDPRIAGVQFLIALHGGFDESEDPQVLFTSKAHYFKESL